MDLSVRNGEVESRWIFIKSVVILNDIENTEIETDYSAGAIEQCFEDNGYCVLTSKDNAKQYMVTPKSVLLVKTDF